MARSQFARRRGRLTPAGGPAVRLARAIAAAAAGLAAAALPALAGPASAEPAAPGQSAGAPVSIAITGMSPSYAAPRRTITLSLQVHNASGTALRGLSVRMLSSNTPLGSRGALESFAQGSPAPSLAELRIAPVTIKLLAPGATWTSPVHVPVSVLQLSCFGVYPLTAQVSGAAGPLASDPTLLPFWPGRLRTCPIQRPKPSDIAWIWPMIDRPRQGPCPGLLDNGLAGSIAPGGRLGDLLAIGRTYAGSARLTWVIDPALLDNVRTMNHPYLVGGSPACGGSRALPASQAAKAWLTSLSATTAGHTVVATPYADVDVAALTQHVRNPDPGRALAEGQRVAGLILHRTFAPGTLPLGNRQLAAVAWPADGVANNALIEILAANKISTVILDSSNMQPVPAVNYTPGAVTSTPDGLGTPMHVLLADHTITALLGSRDAESRGAAAIFRVRQLFLAETAMIAAERPRMPRAIVVAPPRHWSPASKLATGLLADTVRVPWLRPSTVSMLLALPPDHLARTQPQSISPRQLSRRLLSDVARLDGKVALLESIRVPGDPDLMLYRAAFGVESSAWRGGRTAERRARALLSRTSRFVAAQWRELSVVGSLIVTLGGTVSTVPVSISNHLGYPIQVKLTVAADNHSVRITVPDNGMVTAQAHTTKTVKLAVTASSGGSATIRLSLTSVKGRLLPVKPLAMHIRATQFGTVALAILATALAVFVIASAARAIRLGRPGPPEPADEDAGSPAAGPTDRPGGTEKPDNVDPDPPELMPAGPALADQGLQVPGRRSTEGRR